jgi:hypothetical protein
MPNNTVVRQNWSMVQQNDPDNFLKRKDEPFCHICGGLCIDHGKLAKHLLYSDCNYADVLSSNHICVFCFKWRKNITKHIDRHGFIKCPLCLAPITSLLIHFTRVEHKVAEAEKNSQIVRDQNEMEDDENVPRPNMPKLDRTVEPTAVLRDANVNRDFELLCDRELTGLKNLGNTRYMSSILQGRIIEELTAVVKALWSGSDDSDLLQVSFYCTACISNFSIFARFSVRFSYR